MRTSRNAGFETRAVSDMLIEERRGLQLQRGWVGSVGRDLLVWALSGSLACTFPKMNEDRVRDAGRSAEVELDAVDVLDAGIDASSSPSDADEHRSRDAGALDSPNAPPVDGSALDTVEDAPKMQPDVVERDDDAGPDAGLDADRSTDDSVDAPSQVACVEDADGDGRGVGEPQTFAACPEGWVAASGQVDCDDANPLVFPGQLRYFTEPYVPSTGGAASFDYDCNGVEERRRLFILYGEPCRFCTAGWLEDVACGERGLYRRCRVLAGETCPGDVLWAQPCR